MEDIRWEFSIFFFCMQNSFLPAYSAKFKEILEKNLTKKDRVNIMI